MTVHSSEFGSSRTPLNSYVRQQRSPFFTMSPASRRQHRGLRNQQ
jgi:hypothetical protein